VLGFNSLMHAAFAHWAQQANKAALAPTVRFAQVRWRQPLCPDRWTRVGQISRDKSQPLRSYRTGTFATVKLSCGDDSVAAPTTGWMGWAHRVGTLSPATASTRHAASAWNQLLFPAWRVHSDVLHRSCASMKPPSSWSFLLALSLACGLAEPLLAQTNSLPSSGNVGIGTTSPANGVLDVYQSAARSNAAIIEVNNADTGVGYDFGIWLKNRNATPGNYTSIVNWDSAMNGNAWLEFINVDHTTPKGQLAFVTRNGGAYSRRMVIDENGNVGIGTTNPTNKLEVAGTIRTKEVIVETTGWSDYVFAPDYRLAPLSEVEAHIQAKGTLPGIPSAAEVAEHGVSVGDMQAKLLAKIEELTLHVIEQEKRIAELEAEKAAL
jgi:hypothetical protein